MAAEIIENRYAEKNKEVSERYLRDVFGSFVTGVTVVTAATGDGFAGFTVNSFTSVSLSPPIVLFCADLGSATATRIERAGAFAVNILGRHQKELSDRFCASGCDRFSGVQVASAATGAPILHDALAYVDCELDGAVTAGDHRILLGRVLSAGRLCDDKEPLAFYKGGYR